MTTEELQIGTLASPPPRNGSPSLAALGTNAVNAFKLAVFCAVPADRNPVAWWQIAAFGLVSLLLSLIDDFHSTGGQIAWDAVPVALVHVAILLFASIAMAYSVGRSEATLLLLQTFLMIAAAIDVAVHVISLAPTPYTQRLVKILSYKGALAPTLWLALACGKAAADHLAVSIAHRVLTYGLCATLIILPFTHIHRDRGLWQQVKHAKERRASDARKVLDEDAFYEQPKVLERELAAVRPGHRGLIDIYFIGIGGFADQDVFMKEINAVSRLFQERFGTTGKTIRLVNNRKTLSSSPVASVTSLRAALRRVAEVMDKNEDVLFLFLTSHGSTTHRFSLELRPLQLQELEPEKLRALLDESGIENRVVIVSACYSGGFVSSLKDENTLVISASAPDRNSFGCSNEAEWTYFGKAYFDEALRKTHSFVEAFELARPVIAEWERKEGHVASDPQIALGESIKPKLLQLTRQLDSQSNGVNR